MLLRGIVLFLVFQDCLTAPILDSILSNLIHPSNPFEQLGSFRKQSEDFYFELQCEKLDAPNNY